MEKGVGKGKVLEMLADMYHDLEAADTLLHESYSCMREDMIAQQAVQIAALEEYLEEVDRQLTIFPGNGSEQCLTFEMELSPVLK